MTASLTTFFGLLGALLVLAFVANRLSKWTRAGCDRSADHRYRARAFLVRGFFFVLLGVLVDFSGLQKEFLAALGIVAVLFVARLIAVQASRVAWRGTTLCDRQVATLLIPRGLLTAGSRCGPGDEAPA